ncbi:MAG TPA: DUF6152 family protein [Gammaproteobacteria bacterium]|nr:DUF6152 family protein [Gammaproteobacteria bacterium]
MHETEVRMTRLWFAILVLTACFVNAVGAMAHHSFSMYDSKKTYVLTGVVTRISPDPSHLQIFFGVLDEAREKVLRDAAGEPIIWSVELRGSAQVAQDGITLEGFPPGTIFSVGLHPLRNGLPGGGRAEYGLFRCPARMPPLPGGHCDSVAGATSHGQGELPTPTHSWPENR